MIISSILSLLLSNAVVSRRDISIFFNQGALLALIYCITLEICSILILNKGLGLHGGLLHITNITQTFHIFIFFISIIILQLTSFYPRILQISNYYWLKDLIKIISAFFFNKLREHMKIVEYPISYHNSLLNTNKRIMSYHVLFSRYTNQQTCFSIHYPKLLNSYFSHSAIINSKDSITQFEENTNLDPWSLTGFIDGDGSFSILTTKSTKGKLICKIQPAFSIGLHLKDLSLLLSIKKYFKDAGNIYVCKDKKVAYYNVNSVKEILEYIVPHFDNFPLVTQKQADYLLFKEIVSRMSSKEHLTNEGLIKILSLKASLNLGLKGWVADLMEDIEAAPRPKVPALDVLHPGWISGFISAEGCFSVVLSKNDKMRTGYRTGIRFILTQHSRDESLINQIRDLFGSGRVIRSNRSNSVELWIIDFETIKLKIIPFLDKYPLIGSKILEYNNFKRVLYLIDNKLHLTKEGCEQIIMIKENMNTKRK